MRRGKADKVIWTADKLNSSSHPLEPTLRELAGICEVCFRMEAIARAASLAKVRQAWEEEIRIELGKWAEVPGEKPSWENSETEQDGFHPAGTMAARSMIRRMQSDL
mmetsp:Transcript_72307/g.194818  ORF Transcript_72307/g.194818 Transcript_72307/m.194818 type:complete len:107 (+) Transcript_72307:323-643(+)